MRIYHPIFPMRFNKLRATMHIITKKPGGYDLFMMRNSNLLDDGDLIRVTDRNTVFELHKLYRNEGVYVFDSDKMSLAELDNTIDGGVIPAKWSLNRLKNPHYYAGVLPYNSEYLYVDMPALIGEYFSYDINDDNFLFADGPATIRASHGYYTISNEDACKSTWFDMNALMHSH